VVALQTEIITVNYQGVATRLAVSLRRATDDLVLFLHGFGCTKEAFDRAFDLPDLRSFSLCSFDFPGHGLSGISRSSSYSLQSLADIANILVDRLGPRRVFMVGHSMGGAVALIATQDRRDMACLVSVDGNLVAADCGIVSRATAAQSEADFIKSGYYDFAAALQGSTSEDQLAWARWYSQAAPSALYESASSLVEWSDSGKLIELYRALRSKAYLYGDREDKQYLLPLLDADDVHRVQHSGHFIMIDNPADFYSTLSSVLLAAKYERRTRVDGASV
jgi:pimeloyl-ACP methyl ester carboxylesterase